MEKKSTAHLKKWVNFSLTQMLPRKNTTTPNLYLLGLHNLTLNVKHQTRNVWKGKLKANLTHKHYGKDSSYSTKSMLPFLPGHRDYPIRLPLLFMWSGDDILINEMWAMCAISGQGFEVSIISLYSLPSPTPQWLKAEDYKAIGNLGSTKQRSLLATSWIVTQERNELQSC